ncbi:hypothetical protein KAU33_06585, partial [Candidatus Dependentiae bacterium]|nr:hypothetical protein [Candidatus Dependentiae bacterium]
FIISNWTKYNVYNNGIFDFYIDIDGNMIEQMINLSLRCLIGTGEVIRYDPQPTIPQKMGTYEAISTFNNELYKIKAMIYKLTQ